MKKAIVFGAGVSGKGAENLLLKNAYEVFLVDDKMGIKTEDVIDRLSEMDIFVKSPGIPFSNKLIQKAIEEGLEVIDEIELAYRYNKYKIIAVSGTNGKTTTTTKITELLNFAGYKAEFAGNIGVSFAELVSLDKELDFVVLETSSYQLEGIKTFKPLISMIINLTPDHLNRHGSLEKYYRAKFNMLLNQDENDYSFINLDDKNLTRISSELNIKANLHKLSRQEKDCDIFVKDKKVYYKSEEVLEVEKLGLKGVHNLENILFILGTAKVLNISNEKIQKFLYNTKGLEHRMEEFYTKGNLVFINDSKGTNIDATVKALESYEEKLILICGGKNKGLNLEILTEKILKTSKEVYLIGELADKLEEELIEKGYNKKDIKNLKEIDKVVKALKNKLKANESEKILFSPAASSFDQFKNFEERGKIFKKLVIESFGE